MVIPTNVRNKLTTVLNRTDLSKSILINHYEEITQYGQKVREFISQETIRGIIKDYITMAHKVDPAGVYRDASFILQVQSDQEINEQDKVILFNETYTVTRVSPSILGDLIVAKNVILIKGTEDDC